MSTFATIDEAWGAQNAFSFPITRSPERRATDFTPSNTFGSIGGGETIAEVAKVASLRDVDREQYIRQYTAAVFKRRGARGLCRLLGAKTCRSIRNAYLLDFTRDEILILVLVVLVGVLAYRLMHK